MSTEKDHPRLRGEHDVPQKEYFEELGSPPPTRGTPDGADGADGADGITPAYAGNTVKLQQSKLCTEDHPRLRGEHSVNRVLYSKCLGSPPPTRGTLIWLMLHELISRITPAYAGNACLE